MLDTALSIAALTWPAAVVYAAAIVTAGFVVAVLIWSIFRTGQTAIKNENRRVAQPSGALKQDEARA